MFIVLLVVWIASISKNRIAIEEIHARAAQENSNRVVSCVERKFNVKHITLNQFKTREGEIVKLSNYGSCALGD